MKLEEIESLTKDLQKSFDELIKLIGKVCIGTPQQFPYGWRKAAKGRTVWRILEELITQTLECNYSELGFDYVKTSDSEVSVYDFECKLNKQPHVIYINIKSAVEGGRSNKDDISKAEGLKSFFTSDVNKNFYAATFFIRFNTDMSIEIINSVAFPLVWLPDIYVNPSNNGNLQSSKFKDIKNAIHRTNEEFYPLFLSAIEVAAKKKAAKKKA